MTKQSPEQDTEHRAQIAYYKWEFLRRNVAYQKDYADLIGRHGKALGRVRYPRQTDVSRLNDTLRHELAALHFKWGVGFMQDPKWKPSSSAGNPFWEAHEYAVLSDTAIVSWDTVQFKSLAVDLRRMWEWFPLAVNLEARPSTVLSQVKSLLKKARKMAFNQARLSLPGVTGREKSKQHTWQQYAQKGESLLRQKSKPIRLEVEHFDGYLKAWDLKRQGQTVRQIAEALGQPLDPDDSTERTALRRDCCLRTVHRAVAQANRLIAGAYRRIS